MNLVISCKMDFTLKTYQTLLKALIKQGFCFQSFCEYTERPENKCIILRHDVDKLPENSLRFAQIQQELGVKGSYYFRIVPQSFNTKIIEEISGLGHEIGYHYEDFDLAVKLIKNDKLKTCLSGKQVNNEEEIAKIAIELFEKHLTELRKYYPVKTICMHGSPLSKYDNKLLWKYYNYRDFGIIGEPYFDVDFSKVLYLTDTGRRWDGDKVSIRDKVKLSMREDIPLGSKGKRGEIYNYKKTHDIIKAAEKGLPEQPVQSPPAGRAGLSKGIMFTFHPQRWTDKPYPWIKELVWQNTKNVAKYFLNKIRPL